MRIPIVIAAHDRPKSLERLLKSLQPTANGLDTDLIISIDGSHPEVIKVAQEYVWQYGKKDLKIHDPKLGLKQHILHCIQIGKNYDGIILLEDDLWVSPVFTEYTELLMNHMEKLRHYSSFAFYHQHFYPSNGIYRFYQEPFCYSTPFPCSSGFLMLKNEVESFDGWLKLDKDEDAIVPAFISSWTNSWKKSYAAYLLDQGKEVLYPPASVVTNFGDAGEHHKTASSFFQSPLMGRGGLNACLTFIRSYDVYLNPNIAMVKVWLPQLSKLDLDIDLTASKPLEEVRAEYYISTRGCSNPIQTWSSNLKPIEKSLEYDYSNGGIMLGYTRSFSFNSSMPALKSLDTFFPPRSIRLVYKYLWYLVRQRF